MLANSFEKRSTTTRILTHDFSPQLASGETISGATVAAKNYKTGVTDNSVLTNTTASVSGSLVSIGVQAGVNGADYEIIISASTSNSQVLIASLMLRVRD